MFLQLLCKPKEVSAPLHEYTTAITWHKILLRVDMMTFQRRVLYPYSWS